METVAAFFVLWSWGFFIFIGIVTLIMFALIANESSVWGSILLVAFVGALYFFTGAPYLLEHPFKSILYYFAGGILWCIGRWWWLCLRAVREHKEQKEVFLQSKGLPTGTIPGEFKKEWVEFISFYFRDQEVFEDGLTVKITPDGIILPPRCSNHKERIYTWIAFWPWSVLWVLLNEPIRSIAKFIYREIIKGILDKMSAFIFRNVNKDFQ